MDSISKPILTLWAIITLFSCNNQTQKSCYSRDPNRCMLLYVFEEPCFDQINECENYYRMIYQPPFDSCVIISIIPLDTQKAKIRLKWLSNNELREDRLLKNYAQNSKGAYGVVEKEIAMRYVDTLKQLLKADAFFQQNQQEVWFDPTIFQVEMNEDGHFYSVQHINPTDPDFLNAVAYFRKIARD